MARYDSTGRPMMAMIWEAIANIPDRVNEIAALIDPNELQYVGWDDTANELQLMAFDAADIPYDNTVSGLVAAQVQDAIDELAAGVAPTVFFGWVSSTGTTATSRLPAGWTVARAATGRYTVTHGLGLTNVNGLSMVGTPVQTVFSLACQAGTLGLNSFEMRLMQENEALTNNQWFFVAGINE